MNAIEFLVQWAIRSSVLIAAGAAVLLVFRVKDSSVRLAAWVATLCGSIAVPLMMVGLPSVPVRSGVAAVAAVSFDVAPVVTTVWHSVPAPSRTFDWALAGLVVYGAVAFGLLLRLFLGWVGSRRLLLASCDAGEFGIRESELVKAPVTLGIWRPVIVLPVGWREWDSAKLTAVMAHERSHIGRWDPAVQLLSAVHRAALWFSPLSWYLHSRIVRVAEEASDDAAMAVTRDRESYAELLLEFMRRGVCGAGVPMARYGSMDARIQRILDGKVFSRGLTRWSVAAIVALGSPVVYVVAMASPQSGAAPVQKPVFMAQLPTQVPAGRSSTLVARSQRTAGYSTWLGSVTAVTATVMPPIDGRLLSVSFKEGQLVKAGDTVAKVESQAILAQVEDVQQQLEYDEEQLERAKQKQTADVVRELEARIVADNQQLSATSRALDKGVVIAPITGVAGLRLIQPGNNVHTGDPIVTIAQMQPIAVVFTLPQDFLPQVRSRLGEGAGPAVEAWNRDNSVKLATGHLVAIDNQIDEQTGTVKLKATFDNKDNALFPNQFVNVRLLAR